LAENGAGVVLSICQGTIKAVGKEYCINPEIRTHGTQREIDNFFVTGNR
jgi:hypothetical protein